MIGFEGVIDESIIEHLQELCEEENCLFAQIETLDYGMKPLSFPKGENSSVDSNNQIQENTIQKYYKKFIPPYTAVIDLTQSEEEILAAMKPKGRYNIKVAQKNGVHVKQVWKTPENIETFYALMQETTNRDSFSGNTRDYYQNFLQQENTLLFFAEHEDEIIAAGIFIYHEYILYYYYGASSSQKRNFMAPYLLQWTVIQYAKNQGKKLYDFLGIASPDDTNSPLSGVTEFKLKLTPDARYVSESLLFIHKKWKYRVIEVLKQLRKK